MQKIEILSKHDHLKASESYVHVRFNYPEGSNYDIWVPIVYRRTNTNIDFDDKPGLNKYLEKAYNSLLPDQLRSWREEQKVFWETKKADVTKAFFDVLSADIKWHCIACDFPKNPNWARRVQDLKELGYTIATDTNRYCSKCGTNKTHLVLIPLPRLSVEETGNGYETFSPKLRKRIISLLDNYDAYEGKHAQHLLPDHKFSEIRWDSDTKSVNPDDMSEDEIKAKFQLLTNQRNQQKREVCRNCYQTNQRGKLFGINYYSVGTEYWDPKIPKKGKAAEVGCRGCPWYDIEEWRVAINRLLSEKVTK